jgi:hypothetical protein
LTCSLQLSENLKAVGIALRDLGRDDKAATKMTGQFALMKRVTEQLRPDAEVCPRKPREAYKTK